MSGTFTPPTVDELTRNLDLVVRKVAMAVKKLVRNNSIQKGRIVSEVISDADIDTIVRFIEATILAYIRGGGNFSNPGATLELLFGAVDEAYPPDDTLKCAIANMIAGHIHGMLILNNEEDIHFLTTVGLFREQLERNGYTIKRRAPATAGAGGGGAGAAAPAATSVIPCVVCGKSATVRCARCDGSGGLEGWYCGKDCQIVDWKAKGHKAYHVAAAAAAATKKAANNGDPTPPSERKSRKARSTRKHRS